MDSLCCKSDSANHVYGTSEGAGTAILTFLGGFHPQTQALYLSDIAHHQLAICFHCCWSYVSDELRYWS
jgi:hypothetical protein